MHAIFFTGHGFLRIQGAESDAFLQGQLSSDLRQLTPARGQISSYSTAKGRALAVPHLFRRGDGGVLMELPAALLEPTLKRLKMFVLRAKVVLEVAADLQTLNLIGEDAAAWLQAQGIAAPAAPLACAEIPDRKLLVVRRLGEVPRHSVIGSAEALAPLRAALPAEAVETDDTRWRRSDIEAGVPVVYAETRELFIPQMLNLDLLDGIGFDKGCYTGQEIVARLHYLGQVKRRMFVAEVEGAAPAPGSVVVTDDGQAAGEIVDAVAGTDGKALTSVVIQLSHREAALQLKDSGARMMLLRGPEH